MSLTGNVIDIQKIQLTDTFQTWFTKTNEIVDALNPVNLYDIDSGFGTTVIPGVSGSEYNGIKYISVNGGYGVGVQDSVGYPWSKVVALDFSGISGNSYTLTGNEHSIGPFNAYPKVDSEVDATGDYFLVLDTSDTTQTPGGTVKRVKAQDMLPRTLYQPSVDLYGDLRIRGSLIVDGTGQSIARNTLAVSNQYIYLAVTGVSTPQFEASTLNDSGIVIGISGGTNKEIVWYYNSPYQDYISINANYGAKNLKNTLVNSKFIARNFYEGNGASSNAFEFEAAGGSATRMFLSENGKSQYFAMFKEANSSNLNLYAGNGSSLTSVAYIIAGTTSQYSGVNANSFIQYANVDMLDGAHAVSGASPYTIPVADQYGQIIAERHNAGQIKRRFRQTLHGLTTGDVVAIIGSGISAGNLTRAIANHPSTEAIGIVDKVINASEVSVTMKGYYELSANGLKGVGAIAVTGQVYYLDWTVYGGLTTNTLIPQGQVYQPMFIAKTSTSGIVYGNEGTLIFPNATDEVYMRGMIPIGMIQPYAGQLSGLTMGLSAGSINVSDVQYNENYLPCDGRAVSALAGMATGTTGFFDLFNLIGYSYPMRGTVESSNGDASIRIRMDRGTSNLSSLSFGSGTVRAIRRSGTNSVNQEYSKDYTSFTADANTITISGVGITTQPAQLGNGVIVDLLTPKNGEYFFLPDMRGKSPFGQYGPVGALGEGFSLTAGSTGGTAVGNGGLFTNYIIRARRDSDAMILTGHNHDSRYLRKDINDAANAGTSLQLQNVTVDGSVGIGMTGQGNTGLALNIMRNANYGTYASVYNFDSGNNASAGFRANNQVGNAGMYLTSKGANSGLVVFTDAACTAGVTITTSNASAPVVIATNNTERLRINPSGNLGFSTNIGVYTNAPTQALDVSGNALIRGSLFIGGTGVSGVTPANPFTLTVVGQTVNMFPALNYGLTGSTKIHDINSRKSTSRNLVVDTVTGEVSTRPLFYVSALTAPSATGSFPDGFVWYRTTPGLMGNINPYGPKFLTNPITVYEKLGLNTAITAHNDTLVDVLALDTQGQVVFKATSLILSVSGQMQNPDGTTIKTSPTNVAATNPGPPVYTQIAYIRAITTDTGSGGGTIYTLPDIGFFNQATIPFDMANNRFYLNIDKGFTGSMSIKIIGYY